MTEWVGVVAWIGGGILLMLVAISIGARRARRFHAIIQRLGYASVAVESYDAGIFGAPQVDLTGAVRGGIAGTPVTFLFGFCDGRPIAWEGVFHIPRVAMLAALVRTPEPQTWIETWTTTRAIHLGWRPAREGRVLADGTTMLMWESCGQHAATFERLCSALARTTDLDRSARV